ncbi:MAG: sulfatase-like hydrolase/transferase [Verrucomicrobiota bacterium]
MLKRFLLAAGLLMSSAHAWSAERRPNVIIIFTDDQGSIDAGCYGAKDLETPGIDLLAENGVRFTQFYAASPVCSPSRAGLLTGRYPGLTGLGGNAPSIPGQKGGLPPQEVTIAEALKKAGYATAHIGKWHLGYTPETRPRQQGFDVSFGHMGGCIDNFSHFFYWSGPNRHDLWRNEEEVFHDGEFFPDLMLKEASAFMEQNREQPFFIYFAMNTPHYPYQGSPAWRERYKDLPYPRNLYNAFMSTLDETIHQLVKKVYQLGLKEETVIIFQSDHGHSVEVRAHNGGGDNGPYRGHKFTLFEGGIRVPAIISWPGTLPVGEVRGQMAHSCDWFPTLGDLCGVEFQGLDFSGKSLAPVIESSDTPTPHKVLHWQLGNQWAVREGPWKLMGNARKPADGPPLSGKDLKLFLANLKMDVGESKNLAERFPEDLKRLKKVRDDWVKSRGK